MEPRTPVEPKDEDRANRVVLGTIAGLVVLAVAAAAAASMWPAAHAPRVSAASNASKVNPVAPQPSAPATGVASPETPTAAAPATTSSATATQPATASAPRPAPTPAPKPVAAKPVPKTLPELMARRLTGSRQMLIVTGAMLGSNSGMLEIYNLEGSHWVRVLSTAANFGKTGLVDGATRTENHLNTPTGLWYLGTFVFGQHASAPAGTKMPYRHIGPHSWWSAAHNSTYNTWVESRSHVSGEHLADSPVQYEYALNSGFNAPPNQRVIGRGTAIFLHCFEPPGNALGKFTYGCIAISRAEMLKVLTIVDPTRRPSFAIGTRVKGTPTSIWAY